MEGVPVQPLSKFIRQLQCLDCVQGNVDWPVACVGGAMASSCFVQQQTGEAIDEVRGEFRFLPTFVRSFRALILMSVGSTNEPFS